MSNLMEKLAISKKIMDIHDKKPRTNSIDQPQEVPVMVTEQNLQYNIPTQPEIKMPRQINQESIINSKLPDEIKRLMIENPIDVPTISGPVLSDDIIEGASRLMGGTKKERVSEVIKEPVPQSTELKQIIRDVVRDTVRDVVKEELQKAGLLTESNQKTNEIISIRVGSHIFEGTVNRIKKIK